MKKRIFFILLILFSGKFVFCSDDSGFNGGLEFGPSLTTIQGYLPYYGFFNHPLYNKCINGTAGIFVNRFIHQDYLLEMGFYFTAKGTRFIINGANDGLGFRIDLNYLEVPLALYHYPYESSWFCFRYGISFARLLDQAIPEGISYRDHDVIVSFGIRFKPEKVRFFQNSVFLQNFQFLVKLDGSVLPISNPEEIKIFNYSQTQRFQHKLYQHNFGLTFSVQYYLNRFSR